MAMPVRVIKLVNVEIITDTDSVVVGEAREPIDLTSNFVCICTDATDKHCEEFAIRTDSIKQIKQTLVFAD